MARRRQSSVLSRTIDQLGQASTGVEVVGRPIDGATGSSWRHGESLFSVERGCRGKAKDMNRQPRQEGSNAAQAPRSGLPVLEDEICYHKGEN